MKINEMLRCIREASLLDRLVVFIGAGVSKNSGFKLWQEFVKEMDTAIKYSSEDNKEKYSSEELLKIPQFLYDKDEEHMEYFRIIEEEYGRKIDETSLIIDTLLNLNPKHVITTNFDQLIEASLDKSEKVDIPIEGNTDRYTRIVKDADLINAKRNRLFIKMHGDTKNKEHIVLKEEDYLQYSTTHSFIETFIKTLFINHTFLFVGYGVGDYNLKLIMSWVDSIANKYIGEVDRTQHFFINADSANVNGYDKKYLKKRNINVIEYCDLPEDYSKREVSSLTSERGRNLQRCCLFLNNNDPIDYEIDQILEKFKAFDRLDFICFKDVLNSFGLFNFPFYSKIGTTLYIEIFEQDNSAIKTICEILLKDTASKKVQERIQDVFLKCGIKKIKILNTNEGEKEISISFKNCITKVGDYVLENNYMGLRKILDEESQIAGLQYAYILSLLNDERCIECFKDLYQKSKGDKDFFMQMLLGVNLLHVEGEQFSSILLKEVLPKTYIDPYKTLTDYIDDFSEKYSYTSITCAKILKKYNKNNPSLSSEMFQNKEFNALRTEIYDIVKYYIYNSICITASINVRTIWGNYYNIIDTYIDTLFKLASSYSAHMLKASKKNRQPYEEYKFDLMDIYILINLIDNKELKYLMKDNNILLLKCYDSQNVKKYIFDVTNNIINELRYNIENDGDYFYTNSLKDKMKNCLLLLQNFDFDDTEVSIIMDKIEEIVLVFLPLFKNQYYRIYIDILLEIQQLLYYINRANGKSEVLLQSIYKLIEVLIIETTKSDKNDPNNFYLNSIIETNFLLNLTELVAGKVIVEEDMVLEVVKLTENILYGKRFILFASMYSICSGKGKKIIKQKVELNIDRLTATDVYYLVVFKVVESTLVIGRLKELCEQDKERIDIDDEGDYNKPLHVIARLYEAECIDDLEPFMAYAKYNYFFSFVCFPEIFDYKNFKIEWYSSLSREKYSCQINGEIKDMLKSMFKEEMNRSPDEKFKAIYYNLFYDPNADWD